MEIREKNFIITILLQFGIISIQSGKSLIWNLL